MEFLPFKRFSGASLASQLLLTFGFAISTIGVGSMAIAYLVMQSYVHERVHDRAEALAMTVEFATEGPIEMGHTSIVQRTVENYSTLPNVLEIAIVSPSYETFAHSSQAELQQSYIKLHPQLKGSIQAAISQGQAVTESQNLYGKFALVTVLPFKSNLFDDQAQRGVVIAAIDLEQSEKEIRTAMLGILVVMLSGTTGLLLVLGAVIRWLVIKPLQGLNVAVMSLEGTGETIHPERHTSKELRFLAHTLDSVFGQLRQKTQALLKSEAIERMRSEELTAALTNLAQKSEELTEAKADLEVRVEHRTAELTQTLSKMQAMQAQLLTQKKKLKHDALYDRLTGLPNRRFFYSMLEEAIARSQANKDYAYAVIYLDLDHFKVINDSLGHTVGDTFLELVANRLERTLEENGTIARLGGDEFAILLRDIQHSDQPVNLARKLIQAMKVPFQVNTYEAYSGISVGITLGGLQYQTPEALLRDADIAMYRSKRKGRGRYKVFDACIQQDSVRRLQLENDLRRAIAHHDLELYYQPIVSIKEGHLVGFEALSRWSHPEYGFISPAEFIPIAEEIGLIDQLGLWALREGCTQLMRWQKNWPDSKFLSISINLSPIQLQQSSLYDNVAAILVETGLPGWRLKLELTESCILTSTEETAKTLGGFKNLGIQLCIDDFGMGHSSLLRLHQLPIDILKIDRSFIQPLAENPRNSEIVEMIISLAHGTKMAVVAEGIETQTQLDVLHGLGCEWGQGYLYSPPISRHTVEQTLLADHFFPMECDEMMVLGHQA